MKLLVMGAVLLVGLGSAKAGEPSKEQCDVIWRMVLFQSRENSAYGQATLEVRGALVEATRPSAGLKGSSLEAVADLSGKVSTALDTLRPIENEIRNSDAVFQGSKALAEICPRKAVR